MTATDTAPSIDLAAAAPPVQCEAWRTCRCNCSESRPCPELAAWRVSFRCGNDDCTHAAFVMLLCSTCSDQAEAIGPVLARRPL